MHLQIGTIKRIDDATVGEHKKMIVEITNDDERAFVEFRGVCMIDRLKKFNVGDRVEVLVAMNGSVSKKGNRFNNIVAKQIYEL